MQSAYQHIAVPFGLVNPRGKETALPAFCTGSMVVGSGVVEVSEMKVFHLPALRRAAKGFAAVVACTVTVHHACAQDDEAGDDRGLTEYEISCMPCHGLEGRGDGEKAAGLSKVPSDLTAIAKANGGVFPEKRVREMIDGRADVGAHGAREMPVWGERYRVSNDPSDTAKDVDKRARALIDALVRYLRSIQE